MTKDDLSPVPWLAAPEYSKLKSYLISAITRELEALNPASDQRQAVIAKSLAEAYAQTRLQLSDNIRATLFQDIRNEILGYGPIQPLLDDPDVSEVMVNGPKNVYVEKNGRLIKTNIVFDDNDHIQRVIDRIILPLGRRIDADSPMVDARLPDGSRVNAVIPPVAIDGSSITIRKFSKDKLSINQLIEFGSITSGMAEFLHACVIGRLNILISGGTGSGKTTLLNVLSSFIPEDERIVTIEDAAELRLQQEHVLRLETKAPNVENRGAVNIRDLVRNSMRMRPDRIVVGEVRGGEALDMLQAMNTGHDGSLTTIHANSCRDAITRLETMVGMSNANISTKSIRQQISAAVDLFIQIARLSDGTRRVTHLTECVGMEGDAVTLQDIFVFERLGLTPERRVIGRFKATGVRPKFAQKLKASGIELSPTLFETAVDVR